MGRLSNPGFLGGLRLPGDLVALQTRPATAAELPDTIRLILASGSTLPPDRQIADLLNLARAGHDRHPAMVAVHSGQLVSAVLPIVSPGRTMLLFPPAQLHGPFHEHVTRRLIETVCHDALAAGVNLAQVLLDSQDSPIHHLLISCSFRPLAELLYLQTLVPRGLRAPHLPAGWHWQTYSSQTHALFAQTILASYQQSQDCPVLNGLRDIEDILAGHKATGQFSPDLWFVLCQQQASAGVLLLCRLPRTDVFELVYLGLPPEVRRTGVADLLMRQAAAVVSAWRGGRLTLAVDANNLPALRLYWRHGLQAIGKKHALLRDLRVPAVTLGPALQQPATRAPASQP